MMTTKAGKSSICAEGTARGRLAVAIEYQEMVDFILLRRTLVGQSRIRGFKQRSCKNQKAGQFCNDLDIGKFVVTPSYGKLKCVKGKGV